MDSGDTALLCMPLDYIAGKMVVVRALERNMRLIDVKPCGHPLADAVYPHEEAAPVFAAMVPMQVFNSLQVPEERQRLRQIHHLIIGGGAVDAAMAQALADFPNHIWSSYAMTETLSHIALRQVNGPEADEWYTPFDSVRVDKAADGWAVSSSTRRWSTTVSLRPMTSWRCAVQRSAAAASGSSESWAERIMSSTREV